MEGIVNVDSQTQLGRSASEDGEEVVSETEVLAEVGSDPSHLRNESLTQGAEHRLREDKPRSEVAVVVFEEVAVLCVLALQIVRLFVESHGTTSTGPKVAKILVWIYVSLLTAARLLLSLRKTRSFSCLWYHTAGLYGVLWTLYLPQFRSAVIHTDSLLKEVLTSAEFSLLCVLLIFALTARVGNNTELLLHEKGLEPSKELTASILSIATFSWVDPLLWKGYKRTLEIADVWDLIPEDKAGFILNDYRQMRKTTILAWHLLKYFKRQLIKQAIWASFSGVLSFAPTLLLKAILEYLEDSESISRTVAWLLVMLLFVSGCASALCDAFALWTGPLPKMSYRGPQ